MPGRITAGCFCVNVYLKGEFSSNQEQNEKNKLKAVNIGLRAVYRIADDRMYENKRKSKLGRQKSPIFMIKIFTLS